MKYLSLALLCIFITGCAASNGGGHVVGNPLMPEDIAASAPCDCSKVNQAPSCGCGNPKKKSNRH